MSEVNYGEYATEKRHDPAPPAAEPDAVVLHRDDAAWMQQLFENASKMSGMPSLADRAHYMNAAAKLRHLLRAAGGVPVDDGEAVTARGDEDDICK